MKLTFNGFNAVQLFERTDHGILSNQEYSYAFAAAQDAALPFEDQTAELNRYMGVLVCGYEDIVKTGYDPKIEREKVIDVFCTTLTKDLKNGNIYNSEGHVTVRISSTVSPTGYQYEVRKIGSGRQTFMYYIHIEGDELRKAFSTEIKERKKEIEGGNINATGLITRLDIALGDTFFPCYSCFLSEGGSWGEAKSFEDEEAWGADLLQYEGINKIYEDLYFYRGKFEKLEEKYETEKDRLTTEIANLKQTNHDYNERLIACYDQSRVYEKRIEQMTTEIAANQIKIDNLMSQLKQCEEGLSGIVWIDGKKVEEKALESIKNYILKVTGVGGDTDSE